MDITTTYTIKSKANGYIWLFKYHLNGDFISFEILEGTLNTKQVLWLFGGSDAEGNFKEGKFPIVESSIKLWQELLKENFEITIGVPTLDFETLWKLYDYKVEKWQAEKAFKKLKEADKIKLFLSIPSYKRFAQRKNVALRYLATYINQRSFDTEWDKA